MFKPYLLILSHFHHKLHSSYAFANVPIHFLLYFRSHIHLSIIISTALIHVFIYCLTVRSLSKSYNIYLKMLSAYTHCHIINIRCFPPLHSFKFSPFFMSLFIISIFYTIDIKYF